MQGARTLREEAQHGRMTFYEAVYYNSGAVEGTRYAKTNSTAPVFLI